MPLWSLAVDPVMANKFETISGGVNGMDWEKIMLLKDIGLYAGVFLFFSLLALIRATVLRGFVAAIPAMAIQCHTEGAAILSVAGAVFIGLSFL